jgi:hypothetical protein
MSSFPSHGDDHSNEVVTAAELIGARAGCVPDVLQFHWHTLWRIVRQFAVIHMLLYGVHASFFRATRTIGIKQDQE